MNTSQYNELFITVFSNQIENVNTISDLLQTVAELMRNVAPETRGMNTLMNRIAERWILFATHKRELVPSFVDALHLLESYDEMLQLLYDQVVTYFESTFVFDRHLMVHIRKNYEKESFFPNRDVCIAIYKRMIKNISTEDQAISVLDVLRDTTVISDFKIRREAAEIAATYILNYGKTHLGFYTALMQTDRSSPLHPRLLEKYRNINIS